MWVKYKYIFANGKDRELSYIEIPDNWQEYGYSEEDWKKDRPYDIEYALYDYLINEVEIDKQYNTSYGYRGLEYKIVDGLPPNNEILKRYKRMKSNAEYYIAETKRFRKMLNQTGLLTEKDTNIT